MYFGRPWEPPGSPKMLPKTMQKTIRKNDEKIGTQGNAGHARFSAGGGGFPLRIPCGKQARDRGTGPRATGNQYKNRMTTPLRAGGTVADI